MHNVFDVSYLIIIYPKDILLERVKGIEPSQPAWKAGALPLSYTRRVIFVLLFCFINVFNGGGNWIRTSESLANGFTVRPL